MSIVFAWDQALENGCEPRMYPYKDTPLGVINAVLDFKIWSKDSMAVACYFTEVDHGTKFQVSVFKQSDESYRLKKGEIDFTECPTGREYQLIIDSNSKNNPTLKDCVLLAATT